MEDMASPKKLPRYQVVDGIIFPEMFSTKCIRESFAFKPRDDDVIIDTYPKCGTTWMQNVVIQIFRKGRPVEKSIDFLTSSPFLDMMGEDGIKRMSWPGAIKTHLPYDRMPYSPQAKYIFVVRNPLDTCVSFYYHTSKKPGFQFWDARFDDFFELFMTGEVEYNDYFDHLLSWYPHRNDENVYYTTYERMKADLRSVVMEVSAFLGAEYRDAIERDNGVMNNILEHSDFQYMKRMFSKVYDTREMSEDDTIPEGLRYIRDYMKTLEIPADLATEHIRKGVVGGWKNYFSDDQLARLKTKYETKLQGTDIADLWPNLFE